MKHNAPISGLSLDSFGVRGKCLVFTLRWTDRKTARRTLVKKSDLSMLVHKKCNLETFDLLLKLMILPGTNTWPDRPTIELTIQ